MTPAIITVISVLGFLFFVTAVYALWWSAKTGQFKKLESGAKVIFDEDEPIGVQTDFFPASKKSKKKSKKQFSKNV